MTGLATAVILNHVYTLDEYTEIRIHSTETIKKQKSILQKLVRVTIVWDAKKRESLKSPVTKPAPPSLVVYLQKIRLPSQEEQQ